MPLLTITKPLIHRFSHNWARITLLLLTANCIITTVAALTQNPKLCHIARLFGGEGGRAGGLR